MDGAAEERSTEGGAARAHTQSTPQSRNSATHILMHTFIYSHPSSFNQAILTITFLIFMPPILQSLLNVKGTQLRIYKQHEHSCLSHHHAVT